MIDWDSFLDFPDMASDRQLRYTWSENNTGNQYKCDKTGRLLTAHCSQPSNSVASLFRSPRLCKTSVEPRPGLGPGLGGVGPLGPTPVCPCDL